MITRGRYVVIEGQDGTGKTTQADELVAYLQTKNISAIHLKEPGGSPIAEAIREVILNGTLERTAMTNILLFTANRHELWHTVIEPELKSGTWIISARNYWSTLAYQGYGEGADISVISAITETFTDKRYMQPDYGVMLYFSDEESRKSRIADRGDSAIPDTFESKDNDFQKRVSDAYIDIATKYDIPLIDASVEVNEVQRQIRRLINLA